MSSPSFIYSESYTTRTLYRPCVIQNTLLGPHRKISGIGVSRPPVAQAIRGVFVFFGVECTCASKTLNAGKIIRVNGTTTLWEVLVSVCDVLTAKTDVIDINVR